MFPTIAAAGRRCGSPETSDEALVASTDDAAAPELSCQALNHHSAGTVRAAGTLAMVEVRNGVPAPQPGVPLVGRQQELEQGLVALRGHRYVEIQGPAGEGKSTLARHLVAQVCRAWEELSAEEADGRVAFALEVDLRELVGSQELTSALAEKILALVEEPAPVAKWQALLTFLRRQAQVLVLMENAEAGLLSEVHCQELASALGTLHGLPNVHLVLATRVPGPAITGVSNAVVQLRQLPEADGLWLVKAHLPDGRDWGSGGKDRDAARQLVRLVEGNPLVLSVAAGLDCATAAKSGWQDMVKRTHEGLAVGLPKWDTEPGSNKYTALLSQWLASFLTPDDQRLLAAAAMFGGSFTAAGAAAVVRWTAAAVDGGLRRLVDASLLTQTLVHVGSSRQAAGWKEQCYSMHAVIKQAAMAMPAAAPGQHTGVEPAASSGRRLPWWTCILACCAVLRFRPTPHTGAAGRHQSSSAPEPCTSPERQSTSVPEPCTSPAQAYAHWMMQHQEGPGQTLLRCAPGGPAPDMKRRLCLVSLELLNFSTLADVLEAPSQLAGGCVLSLLDAACSVCWQLSSGGHILVAKRLLERVHTAAEQLLGPVHAVTLNCKAALGASLADMGDLRGARRLEEEVLEVRVQMLGPEHITTLIHKGNLASILRDLGELREARRLDEEVLQARLRVLGPEHPETLTSQDDLASTVQALGEWGSARQLGEEVLDARTRVLGPEHPHTLLSKGNLALTLQLKGELREARRLEEEVLEVRTRLLGPEDPDTQASKNNLSVTLKLMGESREARRLQVEVLEVMTRVMGPEHPHTLLAKSNLAGTLQGMGELREARRLQEEVLEGRKRVLGPEHPGSLSSKGKLADVLRDMGEVGKARRLEEEVLQARRRGLGPDHPSHASPPC